MSHALHHRTATLSGRERITLVTLALYAVAWALMPAISQPQDYHNFVDQRSLLGIPHAADVLSNLLFVVGGLIGWRRVINPVRHRFTSATESGLKVFFTGLVLTGFGSAYYHWAPSDVTLIWDRLPMAVTFAGVLGTLCAQRISKRAGGAVLALVLAVGMLSVAYWKATGDLSLYALVQYGGIAGALVLLSFTRRGHDPFPWWALIAWYGVAKMAESGDMMVWEATHELFAGHAVKHLSAGIGGLVMLKALTPKPRY